MKYIITFELTTTGYKERIKRFLETGAPPPDGATLHGRWFTLGHNKGFMLAETSDPTTIYRWVSQWADLINFEVHQVLEDAQIAEVLKSL
ncbi:MAG: DUF3303 domain-containing protein [Candidatus Sumerlaeaceae bacterium]|nr:DUF3303 domain-containing protein [Candidatus Sumerlaeaceae bacterium]